MKEQIKKALEKANADNTWVVHVIDFKEAEELFEGAVERIEQLEKALEVLKPLVDDNEGMHIINQALGKGG